MRILYAKHRERMQTGQFNWLAANVKLALVSAQYIAKESHQFLSELPVDSILIRSTQFTGKDATDGYARALASEFKLYINPIPAAGLLVYQDSGDDTTSSLICYSNDGPGLPLTGIGFNYMVGFNALYGGYYRA